ncbi:hypothetical protein [Megamonas hypermegale]|uniref:hypothetical protein n=1 Tax=Megamonas hypermegale TaxID=158847 RepID=UPI0026EB7F12|nr:hypothetical protein [Megamonas hypermegale]
MAGFGGSVKLVGASQYQSDLKQISQRLKEVTAEMKAQTSAFDKNDTSIEALTTKQKSLENVLKTQADRVRVLTSQYNDFKAKVDAQTAAHNKLQAEYQQAQQALTNIGNTLGKTSNEYQEQEKAVNELKTALDKSTKSEEQNAQSLSNKKIALNNAQTAYNKTEQELKDVNKQLDENTSGNKKMSAATQEAAEAARSAANGGFTVFKGMLSNLASEVLMRATDALKNFATSMIETAAEVKASNSQYEQTFGDFADEATAAINRVADATGIIDTRLKGAATKIYAFARSSGATVPEAMELMETALMAAADSAAYYDRSLDESVDTLQSFLKGNFENDAALGLASTEFTRNAKAAELFGKKYLELTEIQKQQTLLRMVTDSQKAAGAMGQAAREADGWENVQGNLNEAWKRFTANVGTPVLERLVPIIQNITDKMMEMVEDIDWDAWGRSVDDAFDMLIDAVGWVIDNKDLVIAALQGMIAAMVVSKVTAFATSIIGFVTNVGKAVSAAETFGGALKVLFTTISSNPIGLLLTVLAGVGTAIFSYVQSTNDATKATSAYSAELKKQTEEIQANQDSWDELKEAQQESLNADMTQLQNTQNLAAELKNLADANGKVKEGYEGRAGFILGQLNEALGTEYTMTDGIIQKYGELSASIDSLIEKKKAEAILNSQQALYEEAITKQTEAYHELDSIATQLNAKKKEQAQLEEQLRTLIEQGVPTNEAQAYAYKEQVLAITEKIDAINKDTQTLQNNYDQQESLVSEYAYNIGTYEQNMALAHEGKYNEMTTVTWDYVKDLQKAGDTERATLERQISDTKTQLDFLKGKWEETGDQIYKTQMDTAQQQLNSLKEQLRTYTSTTDQGLNENETTWRDSMLSTLQNLAARTPDFKNAGSNQANNYTSGVASGKENAKSTASNLATETANSMNKSGEANAAGQNTAKGFQSGVGSRSIWSTISGTVSSLASGVLASMKNALQIKSPSRKAMEIGRYLIEGLGVGIEDEEQSVLKEVDNFGGELIDQMNKSMSGNLKVPLADSLSGVTPDSLAKNGKTLNGNTAADQETMMVSAFTKALSKMKVEMNGDEMGRFVDKTVTKMIYN